MTPALTDSRVAVVSGKGGVGKTTVAAALATAAARSGKQVLLVEVEGRNGIGPPFGVAKLGYAAQRLAPGVTGLSVFPEEALGEYLKLFYGIGRIGGALARSRAVEFATDTAPGLRDILLIGKVLESERRRAEGRYLYDLVVVDAPPTGRLPRFLDAPRAIVELVHSGPIRKQAQSVLDMVYDRKRLQVVLVTLPEDMPVRETADAAETLRKMGVALGPVVVNGVWPELDARALGRDPAGALRAAADRGGVPLGDEAIARLAEVAASHGRRARNQRRAIKQLQGEIALSSVLLPYLFTTKVALPEIERLAETIRASEAL
jgi:anion-transporting  ArsA/GET3 family ATPase